ncbi:MAG: hypothetical protein ACYTGX_14335 [Planctomycetota bacterium]|jgi:hypothetical protein
MVWWLRHLRQLCQVSGALSSGIAGVTVLLAWIAPGAFEHVVPDLVPLVMAGDPVVVAMIGLALFLLLGSAAGVWMAARRLPKRLGEGGSAIQRELRVITVASLPALALGAIGVPFVISIAAVAGPVNLVALTAFGISAVAVPGLAVWIPIRFRTELTQTLRTPFPMESHAEDEWAAIQRGVLTGMERQA